MQKKVPYPFPGVQVECSSGPAQFPSHLFSTLSLAGWTACVPCVRPEFLFLCAILQATPQVLPLPCVWAQHLVSPSSYTNFFCMKNYEEFSSLLIIEIGRFSQESIMLPYALSMGFLETWSISVVSWVWWNQFKGYTKFSTWTDPPVFRPQSLEEGMNPSLPDGVIRE